MVIWDGLHSDFAEIPRTPRGFDHDAWIARAAGAAAEVRDLPTGGLLQDHGDLVPVVAMLASEGRPVRVLDFGGGAGIGYHQVRAALPDVSAISFVVVEGAPVCAAGRALQPEDPALTFTTEIPAGPFDLVHACSALHYVEDWRGCLGALAATGARWMVLTDVPLGGFPTFATVQRWHDERIPVWFFGEADLLGALAELGFRVAARSRYLATLRGVRSPLPMENFPADRRIPHMTNLLLARPPK